MAVFVCYYINSLFSIDDIVFKLIKTTIFIF